MHDEMMANLIGKLLVAKNVATVWHWKVKSFAMHVALGELYDGLNTLTDELMEAYMGRYGTDAHVPLSDPNAFSEHDPIEFIRQLDDFLTVQEDCLPQVGFLVNKFQELQELVSTTRYKLENLK